MVYCEHESVPDAEWERMRVQGTEILKNFEEEDELVDAGADGKRQLGPAWPGARFKSLTVAATTAHSSTGGITRTYARTNGGLGKPVNGVEDGLGVHLLEPAVLRCELSRQGRLGLHGGSEDSDNLQENEVQLVGAGV